MKNYLKIQFLFILFSVASYAKHPLAAVRLSTDDKKHIRTLAAKHKKRSSFLQQAAEKNPLDRPELVLSQEVERSMMKRVIHITQKKLAFEKEKVKEFVDLNANQENLIRDLKTKNKQKNELLTSVKKQLHATQHDLCQANRPLIEKRQEANSFYNKGLLSFQAGQHPFAASVTSPEKTPLVDPSNTSFNYKDYQVTTRQFKKSYKHANVLFLCVHGTFSSERAFGADDTVEKETEQSPTTQMLHTAARKMALAQETGVKMASFKWSGKLEAEGRKEAAAILADYISQEQSQNPQLEVVVFAHSHGCNVVLSAAQQLQKPIKTAFLAACPDTDVRFKDPDFDKTSTYQHETFNIEKLIHCYGYDDCTQIAGSLQNRGSFKRKLPLRITPERRVYNIALKADGVNLNHKNIKYHMAHCLHELFFCVTTEFPEYFDLIANVPNENGFQKPILSIKKPISDSDEFMRSVEAENKYEAFYGHPFKYKGSYLSKVKAPLNELNDPK